MMKKLIVASALGSLILTTPVHAQQASLTEATRMDPTRNETFMFAGATMRFNGERGGKLKSDLAFHVSGGVIDEGRTLQPRLGEGIALRFGGDSPRLSLAGQDVANVEEQMNLSKGGAVAVGAGVVLGVLLIAFALSDKVDEDFWED